jgi:uncharacterized protein DUF4154
LTAHIPVFHSNLLKKACYSLFFLIFAGYFLYGQNKTATEYQVKAVFLYNFTQFIEWPQSAFDNPDDPFIIGIIGDDPFGSYLDETVAGEKFGTHPIEVQRYNDVKDVNYCHILYINTGDAESAKKILTMVSDKSILTVSDDPGFYKWGGIVRFFTENNKIRLQINVELSRAAELNISSKLLSVAKTN